jgi:hypothetical protein
MISLPELLELDIELNTKIEKYIYDLNKKGVEHIEDDPEYRKTLPLPKSSGGGNLAFEIG